MVSEVDALFLFDVFFVCLIKSLHYLKKKKQFSSYGMHPTIIRQHNMEPTGLLALNLTQ